ncbi:MAG: hypothetical protein RR653_05890 [Clostridia bacterium]
MFEIIQQGLQALIGLFLQVGQIGMQVAGDEQLCVELKTVLFQVVAMEHRPLAKVSGFLWAFKVGMGSLAVTRKAI